MAQLQQQEQHHQSEVESHDSLPEEDVAFQVQQEAEQAEKEPARASAGQHVEIQAQDLSKDLDELVARLDKDPGAAQDVLKKIRVIVAGSHVDLSDIRYSGLVRSFINYLTRDGQDRDDRLRLFVRVK